MTRKFGMLQERIVRQGSWLFKYRGVFPLVLVVPGIFAMWRFHYVNNSHFAQHIWDRCCLLISLVGLCVRVTTVAFVSDGTSGRNTQQQRASELNTSGWYSLVRNPLYLGNYLIMAGIILIPANTWYFITTTLLFWMYYERIVAAEENFLFARFGRSYAEWCDRTPMFIPDPRNLRWKPPVRAFCWRMALKREYSALLLIGLSFLGMNILEHLVAEHLFYADVEWLSFATFCVLGWFAIRTLKKHTNFLTDHAPEPSALVAEH